MIPYNYFNTPGQDTRILCVARFTSAGNEFLSRIAAHEKLRKPHDKEETYRGHRIMNMLHPKRDRLNWHIRTMLTLDEAAVAGQLLYGLTTSDSYFSASVENRTYKWNIQPLFVLARNQ